MKSKSFRTPSLPKKDFDRSEMCFLSLSILFLGGGGLWFFPLAFWGVKKSTVEFFDWSRPPPFPAEKKILDPRLIHHRNKLSFCNHDEIWYTPHPIVHFNYTWMSLRHTHSLLRLQFWHTHGSHYVIYTPNSDYVSDTQGSHYNMQTHTYS